MIETTPQGITPEINDFCREIDPANQPVFVPVQPAAGARKRNCFFNVQDHVDAHGGDLRYGWIIWERPGWYLEAVFHVVWARPDGDLLDITPTDDGERTILFLPDEGRTFEGVVIPNHIRPLSGRSEVRKLVEAMRLWTRYTTSIQTQLLHEGRVTLRPPWRGGTIPARAAAGGSSRGAAGAPAGSEAARRPQRLPRGRG